MELSIFTRTRLDTLKNVSSLQDEKVIKLFLRDVVSITPRSLNSGTGPSNLPPTLVPSRCRKMSIISCNEYTCLKCTDPLLLSTRRSGMRRGDPKLPFDELERELPHALKFGTQDPRFFASAEAFYVVRRWQESRGDTVHTQ